jgi:hypothetical protein
MVLKVKASVKKKGKYGSFFLKSANEYINKKSSWHKKCTRKTQRRHTSNPSLEQSIFACPLVFRKFVESELKQKKEENMVHIVIFEGCKHFVM